MNKEKAVKTASIILGILIAVLLVWIGFRVVTQGRAEFNIESSDVSVSNVTCNSARIIIRVPSEMRPSIDPDLFFVRYSTEPGADYNNFQLIAPFTSGGEGFSAQLTLLPTGMQVAYVISYKDSTFTNAGSPFILTTLNDCSATGSGTTPTPATGDTAPSPTTAPATEPTTAPSPTVAVAAEINCATDCDTVTSSQYLKPNGPCSALQYAKCKQENASE